MKYRLILFSLYAPGAKMVKKVVNKWALKRGLVKPCHAAMFKGHLEHQIPESRRPAQTPQRAGAMRAWTDKDISALIYRLRSMQVPKAPL